MYLSMVCCSLSNIVKTNFVWYKSSGHSLCSADHTGSCGYHRVRKNFTVIQNDCFGSGSANVNSSYNQ